jgi:hypothetical protein
MWNRQDRHVIGGRINVQQHRDIATSAVDVGDAAEYPGRCPVQAITTIVGSTSKMLYGAWLGACPG